MSEPPPLLYGGPRNAILRRYAALTVDDLRELAAAIERLAAERHDHKRVDHGFWYAWYAGPKLTPAETAEIEHLFTDVLVAIASGLSGLDVARFGARLGGTATQGALGWLSSLWAPRPGRRMQEAAIGLIEETCAPWQPRLGVIAAWNAACAVALRGRISAETETILAAPWRSVFGELPV